MTAIEVPQNEEISGGKNGGKKSRFCCLLLRKEGEDELFNEMCNPYISRVKGQTKRERR